MALNQSINPIKLTVNSDRRIIEPMQARAFQLDLLHAIHYTTFFYRAFGRFYEQFSPIRY